MDSKKILSIGVLFFEVFLFLATPYCFAHGKYQEIEIYRSLVEKEVRDSIYHKGLAKYHTSPPPATSSALQVQPIASTLVKYNDTILLIKKGSDDVIEDN